MQEREREKAGIPKQEDHIISWEGLFSILLKSERKHDWSQESSLFHLEKQEENNGKNK